MNEPEPTPEDLIEREIYEKYKPITMKQAIHNTIWYMRGLKPHCTECKIAQENLDLISENQKLRGEK